MRDSMHSIRDKRQRPLRVLVVEADSADTCVIFAELANDPVLSTEPVLARRVTEAVGCLQSLNPDVALIDLDLPDSQGYATFERIRREAPDVPLIVITDSHDKQLIAKILYSGAQDCVVKGNYSNRLLGRAIENAVERHRFTIELDRRSRALTESEHRVRAVIDSCTDAMVVVSDDGTMRFCNAAAARMFGRSIEDLVGSDFGFPISTGSSTILDLRHTDGTAGMAELRVSEIVWSGERAMLALLRDLSDYKRIEYSLHRNEAELLLAQRVGGFGSWRLTVSHPEDVARRQVIWSEESLRILGADPAHSAAREISWWGAFHPIDRELVSEELIRCVRLRARFSMEFRIVRADGSRRRVHAQAEVLNETDRPSNEVTVIGTLQDVTERAQAEISARRLNRVYAMLSGINAIIVRAHDRHELFDEACHLAVEAGALRSAWIGRWNEAGDDVLPIAWAGGDGTDLSALHEPRDHGIRGGAEVIRGALEQCHAMVVRGESMMPTVVLPLIVEGRPYGVFSLTASEEESLDSEEIAVLEKLAADIAFALDHITKNEAVRHLAMYDQLTGLANRVLFRDRLAHLLETDTSDPPAVAVALFDIERFRTFNDVLGQRAGDTVLQQLARRLVDFAGNAIPVARVGDDCFALILTEETGSEEIAQRVERHIADLAAMSFDVDGQPLQVSVKAGVAVAEDRSIDTLFGHAEVALKKAKQQGERYLFYRESMNASVARRLSLESKLRQALSRDEFVIHYQPMIECGTRRVVAMEALLRWNAPDLGLVAPAEFIPMLEETGLILEVGEWTLAKAVADHHHLIRAGLVAPRICVNISQRQLLARDFVSMVRGTLMSGAAARGIDLEMTESLLIEENGPNVDKLVALREFGVGIGIDDFGTGYSSLRYLAKLPVTSLKIDRSFIAAMLDEPDSAMLVSTIISLAHSLRMYVTAEGVETSEQANFLRLLRCDQLQGFLFGRPMPIEDTTRLLQDVMPVEEFGVATDETRVLREVGALGDNVIVGRLLPSVESRRRLEAPAPDDVDSKDGD